MLSCRGCQVEEKGQVVMGMGGGQAGRRSSALSALAGMTVGVNLITSQNFSQDL
jgi:hypothetical protein